MTTQHLKTAGPNLYDQSQGCFHVHAANCRDLRNYGRGGRLGGELDDVAIEFDSKMDLVHCWYSNQIDEQDDQSPEGIKAYEDMCADDFKFFPCVTLPWDAS